MFAEPNDEEPEDPAEKITRAVRDKMDSLEEGARSIGLYMQGVQVTATLENGCEDPTHDHSEDAVNVTALFIVGEQAFTDRVADPDAYRTNQEFGAITHGVKAVDEEAAATAKRIADEGIDALLDDDEEDDA